MLENSQNHEKIENKIEDKIFSLEQDLKLLDTRIKILKDIQKGRWKSFGEYFYNIRFPGCSTDSNHEGSGLYYDTEKNILHVFSFNGYTQGGSLIFDGMVSDVIMIARKFGVKCIYGK